MPHPSASTSAWLLLLAREHRCQLNRGVLNGTHHTRGPARGAAATRASTGASSPRAPAGAGARPHSGPSRDASRRASPRAPRRRAGPGQQGGAQRPGVGSVAAPAFRARALPQNGGASQGPPASLPAAPTAVAAACAAASRGRLKVQGMGGVDVCGAIRVEISRRRVSSKLDTSGLSGTLHHKFFRARDGAILLTRGDSVTVAWGDSVT